MISRVTTSKHIVFKGCEFVGAESVENVTVIARYTEGEATGRAAGVLSLGGA